MKLFILACVMAAATASPLLGSNKCTQGPSYWCQGLKQAVECGAVEHCKQKVWPLKNKDECETCVLIATQVKVILSNKETAKEVIEEIENMCSRLGPLQSQCKALIDQYAPLAITYLKQLLQDPKQLCKELSLCSTKEKSVIFATLLKKSLPHDNLIAEVLEPGPVLMEQQHSVKKDGTSTKCILCEFIMREMENEISKKSTQEEIKNALEKVCSVLPSSISSECSDFVEEYAPAVLEILANELDPKMVCTSLSLCQEYKNSIPVVEGKEKEVKTVKTVKNNELCVLCEFVMKELDTILGENATEGKIEEALDKVCNILPSTVSHNCTDFVAQYTPILLQLLQSLSPDEICKVIGLCTQSAKEVTVKTAKVGASPECIVCEFVMDKLENSLKQNGTEQNIEKFLDEVCSLLPSSISTECKDFVSQYTPTILQLLIDEISPSDVCTKLGLCRSSKISKPAVKKIRGIPGECQFCQYFMGYLAGMLTKNATEQDIEKALDKICASFPSSIRSQCQNYVDEYTPTIVHLLVNEFSPHQVCIELGMCSKSKILKPVAKKRLPKSGELCTPCKTAFTLIKQFFANNRTEEALIQDLEKFCSELPQQIANECSALAAEYGKEILDLLFNMPVEQLCTELGFCTSLGSKEKAPCFLGAQYWCSNMAAAVKCDAVHHCKNHVW